jgi:hypothetical protein
MVTPLRYFKVDPNRLGRDSGIYYHRGHGIFSKYNIQRDYNIQAEHWKIDRIGLPRRSSFLHTGDGKLPKYYHIQSIKRKMK